MLESGPNQRAADRSVVSFCRCRSSVSRRIDVSCRGGGLGIFRIAGRAIVFAHPIDWLLAGITTESQCDDNDVAWGHPAREPDA